MSKKLIVLLLLLLLFSCSQEKSQKNLANVITKSDSLSDFLSAEVKNSESVDRNTLKSTLKDSLIFKGESIQKRIDTTDIEDDTLPKTLKERYYWKQKSIHIDPDSTTTFLHPKLSRIEDKTYLHYFKLQKREDTLVQLSICEKELEGEEVVLDSCEASLPFFHYPPRYNYAHDPQLLLLSLNIMVRDSLLYYGLYKKRQGKYNPRYHAYYIGSGGTRMSLDEEEYRSLQNPSIADSVCYMLQSSPDKRYTAFSHYSNLAIYKTDSLRNSTSLYSYFANDVIDTAKGDMTLNKYWPQNRGYAEVGGLSWQEDSKRIYFGNHGLELACIWYFDIVTKEVRKIVPEHEAKHPFYFKKDGIHHVLYAEKNAIKWASEPKAPLLKRLPQKGKKLKKGELQIALKEWVKRSHYAVESYLPYNDKESYYPDCIYGDSTIYSYYNSDPRTLFYGYRSRPKWDSTEALFPPNGMGVSLQHLLTLRGEEASQDLLQSLETLSGINPIIKDSLWEHDFMKINADIVYWAAANLLPSPSEYFGTFSASQLYNALFAPFCRRSALGYLYLRDYATGDPVEEYRRAMKEEGFDGTAYLSDTYNDAEISLGEWEGITWYTYAVIGFWLRRSIDGSKEALWRSLENILLQYDASWYLEISEKKRWYRESSLKIVAEDYNSFYEHFKYRMPSIDSIIDEWEVGDTDFVKISRDEGDSSIFVETGWDCGEIGITVQPKEQKILFTHDGCDVNESKITAAYTLFNAAHLIVECGAGRVSLYRPDYRSSHIKVVVENIVSGFDGTYTSRKDADIYERRCLGCDEMEEEYE